VIARRWTLDNIEVCLWSDGVISGAYGFKLKHVPLQRIQTPERQQQARKVGWLMLGHVCILSSDELGLLFKAAMKAAKGDGLPGTMRKYLHEIR
jgi:hypothetical protein